jgi:hypothetical protein
MTADGGMMDEFALAADGLAATAAHISLRRVHDLCVGDPSRSCLHETMALSALSARIGVRLIEGEEALSRNDSREASSHWSRALLLMNRMAKFATAGTLPRLAAHQKSGSAG